MKRLHTQKIFFFFFALFISTASVKAIYNDSYVGGYEEELKKFPCDYQEKIKELHTIYPNAVFVAQTHFFDWKKYKEIPVAWDDMFKVQFSNKSLISASAKDSYKTDICAQKGSNNVCSWYHASEEAITYYMNPYNFLNETNVFMFESLYSKSYHTKEGVESILKGSFMANKICPGSEKTYAEVLLEAGEKNNVSPYMLASRLIQEQGRKGTSSLISGTYAGYEGYYNYFNIQASGTTDQKVIENGLACAKGILKDEKTGKLVCEGNNWTSPYISIVEGAKFVYKKYVGVNDTYNVKGQMSLYLQKWDPYGPNLGGHQYMQNIQAPVSESTTTYKSYQTFADFKNYAYVFYIPIYEGAPNTQNTSCVPSTPVEEEIKITNYKIKDNYISGIKIGMSHEEFSNNLKGNMEGLTVTIEKNANNTTDKVATGDTVTLEKGSQKVTYQVVIYGDVNGDSNIWATDYVQVKNAIKGTLKLEGAYKEAADVNHDSNIWPTDYVQIKNHIKGTSQISQ